MPWLDIIVGLLLLNALFVGWREGFFASVFRCVGLLVALYLTDLVTAKLQVPPVYGWITFAIVFALALWLCQLVIRLVTHASFGRFGLIDNLLGVVTNLVFTIWIVGIILSVILSFDPNGAWVTDSLTYRLISDHPELMPPVPIGQEVGSSGVPEP